jgi:hypothetical protein
VHLVRTGTHDVAGEPCRRLALSFCLTLREALGEGLRAGIALRIGARFGWRRCAWVGVRLALRRRGDWIVRDSGHAVLLSLVGAVPTYPPGGFGTHRIGEHDVTSSSGVIDLGSRVRQSSGRQQEDP